MLDYTGNTLVQFPFWSWTSQESGAAQLAESLATGGWPRFFQREQEAFRKRRRRIEELQEAEKALQNQIDREIAALLHRQEIENHDKKELKRLTKMVDAYASDLTAMNSERVNDALRLAKQRQTIAAFEALAREVERAEEQEFLALIIAALH